MNSSLPEESRAASAGPERSKLARRWAHLLSTTACIPLTNVEVEQQLIELVGQLCDAVITEAVGPCTEAGAQLVELRCTGPACLRVSVDVLGKGLLGLPELRGLDRLPERVIGVLGAFGSGYADRIRLFALDQQDVLGQSMLSGMRAAQRDLRASEARFDELLRTSSNGVAITDLDGHFERTNEALAVILGRDELGQLSLFDLVHPDDAAPLRADYQALIDGGATRIHEWRRLVREDGELAWVSLRLSLMDRQVMVLAEDSTEIRLLQGQLNRQLLHDVLTWLPNRQFFSSRLEKALRTADPAVGVSVYHLDLDSFSMITCGLGRQAGDQLLKVVADRLKEVVAEETAMVARFGCDEFAILVENTPRTPAVVEIVRRINEKLAEPAEIDGRRVATSASIGVVHRPSLDSAAVDLLDAADLTLRRAKNNGRRQWELFDPTQDARDRERFSLAVTMPGAWQNGELQVRYRPVVRLADRQAVAVEARLSWVRPVLGDVPHDECVRLADLTGLMIPLGNWLLRSACVRGHDLPVRVGLTASQLADPDLLGATREMLDETGLGADQLRLGIPLGALAAEEALETLKLLAAQEVGIEIDDFGMSPDGLLCLAELPIGTVKITRTLMAERNSWQARALRDLVALVHQAGVSVTAGGVDTRKQADWWRWLGADSASGRLFSR
jgi:diguanylate cyclase (GGDEF)-like protein/PAS domain S-box-containing protein